MAEEFPDSTELKMAYKTMSSQTPQQRIDNSEKGGKISSQVKSEKKD